MKNLALILITATLVSSGETIASTSDGSELLTESEDYSAEYLDPNALELVLEEKVAGQDTEISGTYRDDPKLFFSRSGSFSGRSRTTVDYDYLVEIKYRGKRLEKFRIFSESEADAFKNTFDLKVETARRQRVLIRNAFPENYSDFRGSEARQQFYKVTDLDIATTVAGYRQRLAERVEQQQIQNCEYTVSTSSARIDWGIPANLEFCVSLDDKKVCGVAGYHFAPNAVWFSPKDGKLGSDTIKTPTLPQQVNFALYGRGSNPKDGTYQIFETAVKPESDCAKPTNFIRKGYDKSQYHEHRECLLEGYNGALEAKLSIIKSCEMK